MSMYDVLQQAKALKLPSERKELLRLLNSSNC